MKKKKKMKNYHIFSIFMFVSVCVFYLFFALYDGAVICVDSPTYIEMSIIREPVYPMFLAFLRSIFTQFDSDFYLTAAVILQSLLAAFSAWSFASYILREYKISRFLSLLILYTPPRGINFVSLCRPKRLYVFQ